MYVRAMQNSFESENIKTLHRLVGGRVEALEFNVAPGLPFIGVPLKDLTLRKGLLVQASCAAAARRSFPPAMTPCRRGTMLSSSPPTQRCMRCVTL